MYLIRLFKHLLTPPWCVPGAFPQPVQQAIETAIQRSEREHSGQIRLAVEGALQTGAALRNQAARERALEVFTQLRIWDTEQNNGVLIYLLLADRDVEIVVDRGLHKQVPQATWEAICQGMETEFRHNRFESGVLLGIDAIGKLLATYYPAQAGNSNELPDHLVHL